MKRRAASLAAVCAAALAAAAPRAVRAAPWNTTFAFTAVSPKGDGLLLDQKPVRFACADVGSAIPEDEVSAIALAGELWAAGFDLVCVADLAAPETPDDPETPAFAPANAFVAACRSLGVRVWAEAMGPVSAVPPSPGDVALVDDPSTADAWTNAVSGALADPDSASRVWLAAPWDPRLEVALQRRVRAWGRAFNPRTGLRRCEDPVFALFSFSSSWLDEMCAPDRAPLPEFFESSLRNWWGNWLYDLYGSDEKAEAALGAFLPGETVVSNTVAFPSLDPADTNRTDAFRSAQRLFLRKLDLEHLRRVVAPFSLLGPTARVAPRLVSNTGKRTISSLSTVSFAGEAAALRPGSAPRPIVWRVPVGASFSDEARAAAKAGASVFSVPVVAPSPDDAASDAVAVFRATLAATAFGAPSGADGLDAPQYARGSGVCFPPAETNAPAAGASFPQFGAEIRFAGGKGDEARRVLEEMTASSNAAPALLVVHLPPSVEAPEGFRWTFRARRDDATGAIPVSLSIADAATDEPVPFGLLAGGTAFARKSMVEGPVASAAPEAAEAGETAVPAAQLSENGVFSREIPGGRAFLTFRPALLAPAILRASP